MRPGRFRDVRRIGLGYRVTQRPLTGAFCSPEDGGSEAQAAYGGQVLVRGFFSLILLRPRLISDLRVLSDYALRARRRVASLSLVLAGLVGMAVSEPQAARGLSVMYDYTLIARQESPVEAYWIKEISPEVSVNEDGNVALIAATDPGSNLVVGRNAGSLRCISESTDARFYGFPQINNKNVVVTRELMGGRSAVRTWSTATEQFTLLASTTLSQFTQLTIPTLGNTEELSDPPLVGFLGRVNNSSFDNAPFAYFANRSGVRNEQDTVSGLAAEQLTSFRAMAAHTSNLLFVAQYSSPGDGGRVVAFTYDQVLLEWKEKLIASTVGTRPWGWLGVSPGIADSGKIIAFAGDNTARGEGIYVVCTSTSFATDASDLTNVLSVITTNTVIAYDDTGRPITLSAFDRINRVGVLHEELGAPGLPDDVVTLCFMATPSKASRANPNLGKSLLFSDQPGIWSLRVDIKSDLAGPALHLNSSPPVAVVQLADTIAGDTVTALALYDPLAPAWRDKHGNPRIKGVGDHFLAFSADTAAGTKVVRADWLDADEDGLMDFWETYGIDIDRDGVVDLKLPTLGANPLRRDLFLEIDWTVPRRDPGDRMWTNAPPPGAIERMVRLFAAAPWTNLDLSTGIVLHVDAGSKRDPAGNPYSFNMGAVRSSLQGGDLIGMPMEPDRHPDMIYIGMGNVYQIPGVAARPLDEVKEKFFGNHDKWAREFAFKYAVLADCNDVVLDTVGRTNLVYDVAGAGTNSVRISGVFSTEVDGGHLIKVTAGRGAGQLRTVSLVGFFRNLVEVHPPWSVTPDATSRVVILGGWGGTSEINWYQDPNNHPLAGNDYLVTKGGFRVNAGGWLSDARDFSSTLSHELGHTLGLRHGGTDHTNNKVPYQSIMNYRYSNALTNFSGAADPVFNDWANLRYVFQNNSLILGNAFGLSPYAAKRPDDPDPTIAEYIALVGHGPDLLPPMVVIDSPTAGTTITPGGRLEVRMEATDDSGIASVVVYLDADGDGQFQPDEIVGATLNPDGSYRAVFPALTGPQGVRKIRAVAEDSSGNQRAAETPVVAGDAGENGAVLHNANGLFAAQPTSSAGGTRQTTRVGPIQVAGSGQMMFSLAASPIVGPGSAGTNSANATITGVNFLSEDRVDWLVSDLVAGNESHSTVYWQPPAAGPLYVEISGPALEDFSGGFLGSPPQNYSLILSFRPVDATPPQIGLLSPATNGFVELGQPLRVRVGVTDDYGVASVIIGVDANGNGDPSDPGEVVSASLESPNVYVASFGALGGAPGNRSVLIIATDTAGLVTRQASASEIRTPDTVPPTLRIISPEPGTRVQKGNVVSVSLEAGDDRGLETVSATLDLDGNGAIQGTSETVAATNTGRFSFRADFAAISGPSGARIINVVARDTSGNTNLARLPITVGGVETNAVTLTNKTGTLPAQGSQWVGGNRQIVNVGPVTLPSAGTVRFVVSAAPNCRVVGQTTSRYDPIVDQVTLNGKTSNTAQSWNAAGSNPAIGTSAFVATEPGSLSFRILGAAVYNSWGEFDGSPAQTYTLDVQLEAFDNVRPDVAFAVPALGANLELGKPLTVEVSASDTGGLASVLLFFDANGDGDTEDLDEMQPAQRVSGTTYRVTFPSLSGPPGTRTVSVLATDTSLNTSTKWMPVGCGGVGGGEAVLFGRTGFMTNNGTRQTIKCEPVNIPGVGRITLRVLSTPNTRQAIENLTRYDAAVRSILFKGVRTALSPACNPPGSNPAECVSVWDSPGPGTLEAELVGPAVYNSWGEYSGHPPTTYSVEVLYRPGPTISSVLPASGMTAGSQNVEINGSGFSFNPTVLFNNVAAQEVVRLGATKLECMTPPGVPGNATVTVLNSDAEGSPWNYGPPYSLYGRLANGFEYVAPPTPLVIGGERLLGTYAGHFDAVVAEQPQREQSLNFTIPGEGRLRFAACAFVPILNPLPGPFENPDDLSYHNESTAVRRFYGSDGWAQYPVVDSSDVSYPFGPVVTEAKGVIGKTAAGASRFVVTGPARWNAFWRQFGEFEMVSAPTQDWSLAVWFAARPYLLSIAPATGQSGGGTLVTLTGSNLVDTAVIRFGGQPATDLKLVSPTAMTCRPPLGLQGVVDVELEFADMKSILPRAFTVTELRISSIVPPAIPGGSTTVRLQTEVGRRYQLQRCVDLNSPLWSNVGESVSGDGTVRALVDPTSPASVPYAFYRVIVLQ